MTQIQALIVGGGPAGLMAAETLSAKGLSVLVADAKPSVARKFLMAGKSGLNLTKNEEFERFLSAYPAGREFLAPMLAEFGPGQVRDWAEGLGQPLFTGSTGRVFPQAMKASPLLRAWLARLNAQGVAIRNRWRWLGWQDSEQLFDTPDGGKELKPDVTILALGGGSWARLGSDGAWTGILREGGIPVEPFQASNAGLNMNWSLHMKRWFGAPLKGVALSCGGKVSRGEIVISSHGVEGGGVYPLAPQIRAGAPLTIDLAPDRSLADVRNALAKARPKDSVSNQLRKTLRLDRAAIALVMECLRPFPVEPAARAELIKSVPIMHLGLRPLDEAISTSGGVPFRALTEGLMLTRKPGVFCAGEMLDWDAPTGGYLLTACLASGRWAGCHAARYVGALEKSQPV